MVALHGLLTSALVANCADGPQNYMHAGFDT